MNIPRAMIWPTETFNTCTPDGMATAEAWVRGLVAEPECEWTDNSFVVRVHPSELMAKPDWSSFTHITSLDDPLPPPKPTDQVFIFTDGSRNVWDGNRYRSARPLPPPKPGTRATAHHTHWTDFGERCCQCHQILHGEAQYLDTCPPANRTTERTA